MNYEQLLVLTGSTNIIMYMVMFVYVSYSRENTFISV